MFVKTSLVLALTLGAAFMVPESEEGYFPNHPREPAFVSIIASGLLEADPMLIRNDGYLNERYVMLRYDQNLDGRISVRDLGELTSKRPYAYDDEAPGDPIFGSHKDDLDNSGTFGMSDVSAMRLIINAMWAQRVRLTQGSGGGLRPNSPVSDEVWCMPDLDRNGSGALESRNNRPAHFSNVHRPEMSDLMSDVDGLMRNMGKYPASFTDGDFNGDQICGFEDLAMLEFAIMKNDH